MYREYTAGERMVNLLIHIFITILALVICRMTRDIPHSNRIGSISIVSCATTLAITVACTLMTNAKMSKYFITDIIIVVALLEYIFLQYMPNMDAIEHQIGLLYDISLATGLPVVISQIISTITLSMLESRG